jgi:hypothetical protein
MALSDFEYTKIKATRSISCLITQVTISIGPMFQWDPDVLATGIPVVFLSLSLDSTSFQETVASWQFDDIVRLVTRSQVSSVHSGICGLSYQYPK